MKENKNPSFLLLELVKWEHSVILVSPQIFTISVLYISHCFVTEVFTLLIEGHITSQGDMHEAIPDIPQHTSKVSLLPSTRGVYIIFSLI